MLSALLLAGTAIQASSSMPLRLSNTMVKLDVNLNGTGPLLSFATYDSNGVASPPLLSSFHGKQATSILHNPNNVASAYRVLIFDHLTEGRITADTPGYSEIILTASATAAASVVADPASTATSTSATSGTVSTMETSDRIGSYLKVARLHTP